LLHSRQGRSKALDDRGTVITQVPVDDCMTSYKLSKFQVEGLQDSAGRNAAMVVAFCERMGYDGLQAVLSKFQARISHANFD